jgi:hypothetical protein
MRFGEDELSQSAPAETSSVLVNKTPRPQPKGLKARYQPFGVPTGGKQKVGTNGPSENDDDVEMTQAPPLLTSSADTPKKAAKKRKHGDVEKGTPSQEEAASTSIKKSKKARVDESSKKMVEPSSTKAVKQTPITAPVVPSLSSAKLAKPAASVEQTQPAPVKKSKGKEKSKQKDSTPAVKASDPKKPAKVTPVLPPAIPGVKSP